MASGPSIASARVMWKAMQSPPLRDTAGSLGNYILTAPYRYMGLVSGLMLVALKKPVPLLKGQEAHFVTKSASTHVVG